MTLKSLLTIINNISDSVFILNSQNEITYINSIAEQLTSFSLSKLKNKPLYSYLSIVDSENNKIDIEAVLQFENEYNQYINKDLFLNIVCKKIPIELKAFPLEDESDLNYLIISDKTEEYRLKKEYNKNIDELYAIINALPGLVSVVDTDFNVLVANDEVYKKFGNNGLEEILGRKCYKTRKGLDAPCPQCNILKAFESHKVECRLSNENEERIMGISTKAYGVPLFDENGKVWGGVEVILDVSDVRQKEKEIIKKDELLNRIAENFPNSILSVIDKMGVIQYISGQDVYKNISLQDNLVGKNIDILLESNASYLNEIFSDTFSGNSNSLELQIDNKYFLYRTVPLKEDNDSIDKILLVIENITDRKQSEEEIKLKNEEYLSANEELMESLSHIQLINSELEEAKEKAEESDRLKSAFLANMSHEIRTPMNGILGFADLLKTDNLEDCKREQYLSIIEQSGERMLNTINALIDISKIEAGQVDVDYSNVDIIEVFKYIHGLFLQDIEKKGLKLICSNEKTTTSDKIFTDKEKLISVLTNLIKNAIKYTDNGYVKFGVSERANELMFYVTDSGIGIPDDRVNAIFERFTQADIEDRDARQGSGLGLTIAKSYVELLGGKIWVDTSNYVGTTFYFTVPINNIEVEPKKEIITNDAFSIEALSNISILVCEDDLISCEYLRELLSKFTKKLIFAHNGFEAIAKVEQHPDIDIVLMDIKMPKMDGVQATKEIKQIRNCLPIIAQTAYSMFGDKEKMIESGFDDYITKPINRMELLRKIKLLKHRD